MRHTTALLLAAVSASLPAFSAENEAIELERADDGATSWRISVGVRTAPSIKTKATLDVPAAIRRAGGRIAQFGKSSASKTTSTTPGTGTTGNGRTREEALAAAERLSDGSYEFDNGYIRPDSACNAGEAWNETWNWNFNSTDAFSSGAIVGTTAFGTGDGSSRTTTRRETKSSISETVAPGNSDSSDEGTTGFDIELARELWQNGGFGVDLSLGWTLYQDVDVFSMGGRAYTGRATTQTATETTISSSGSTGEVETRIPVDSSFDLDFATMPDGSIGGASYDGMPSQPDWRTPLLTFDPENVSTTVTETGSGDGGTTTSRSAGAAKSRSRTIDVYSEGKLSLQEVRLGVAPWWDAADWLRVRALLGVVSSYAEVETNTRILVNGSEAFRSSHTDDDWKVQGYAGLAVAVAPKDWLEFSAGIETRFPSRKVRFDDGIISGSVELSNWDAFVAIGVLF